METLVVFDEKNWERKVDELLYSLPSSSLVFLPSKSHYIEREDIFVIFYGSSLRRIDSTRKYPNEEPGRILELPDGLLGELMFAFINYFKLPDDYFSSLSFEKEDTFYLEREEDVAALLESYPFSATLSVLLHIEKEYDPVRLAEAFLSASYVCVIAEERRNHKRLEKRCDKIIFSPMVRRFSSLCFLDSEEDAISLLPSSTTIVRIYLRSDK